MKKELTKLEQEVILNRINQDEINEILNTTFWTEKNRTKYLRSEIRRLDDEICDNMDLEKELKTKILAEAVGIEIDEAKEKIYKFQRQLKKIKYEI